MTTHCRGCVLRAIREPMTGFEPVTSSLPRKCSTTELHWQICLKSTSVQPRSSQLRAEDEAQTRDPQLGRLMLYQLSYFRMATPSPTIAMIVKPRIGRRLMWAQMDSNHRRRKPADLQSAPFGHSGIRPIKFHCVFTCRCVRLSLLSDSNQRPRDYKSRALAN